MIKLDFGRPLVMAIMNATDDSFYAASRTAGREALLRRAEQVAADGASIVDIGGCSSRPGAAGISLETEWERVKCALTAVREVCGPIPVSVDTFRSAIVRRAVENFGEIIVNDISAATADPEMAATAAELGLPFVAMHMRGTPQSMQSQTRYDDVVSEVRTWLLARAGFLAMCGVRRENIILDPGFGFAKSLEQNYSLLKGLHTLCGEGFPVLAGLSRKSMIYRPLGTTPEGALCGTQVLQWEALRQGARILRVHDVREAVQTITLYETFDKATI